jgi:hypothetical protein
MLQVDSWLELLPSVAITAALAGPLAFFAGLGTHERKRLWKRARRVKSFR